MGCEFVTWGLCVSVFSFTGSVSILPPGARPREDTRYTTLIFPHFWRSLWADITEFEKKNHRKLRTGPNPKIIWNKYSENTFIVYAKLQKKKKKEKPVSLPSLNSYVCICSLYPWIFRVTWCSLCLQAFFPPNLLTSPLCNFFAPSHFFYPRLECYRVETSASQAIQ